MQTTWIYSFPQPFEPHLQEQMLQAIQPILAGWKAHGEAVHSVLSFPYQQFIRIETRLTGATPSGCSIDSFQREMKKIFHTLQVAPSEPSIVYYFGANHIEQFHFSEAQQLIESGILSENTIILDTASASVGGPWERKLSETWLSKYLQLTV
ncbi:MAG: hypothetical protein NZ108_07715 [Bacteroidia bacterium]|nr:hypothetical protein [Bacteroidia bacterium]